MNAQKVNVYSVTLIHARKVYRNFFFFFSCQKKKTCFLFEELLLVGHICPSIHVFLFFIAMIHVRLFHGSILCVVSIGFKDSMSLCRACFCGCDMIVSIPLCGTWMLLMVCNYQAHISAVCPFSTILLSRRTCNVLYSSISMFDVGY